MKTLPPLEAVVSKARARVEAILAKASPSSQLVGYDVNGIQEYVTANSRPIAMSGASLLITKFDEETGRRDGALFAGGGRGLLLVSEQDAARLLNELPSLYEAATVTGVLTIAAVPWDAQRARASLQWLKLRLQSAKDTARRPYDPLPDSKGAQCRRCRAYKGVREYSAGDEMELVCARCERVTEHGQHDNNQRGLSLVDFSEQGYVAAISADGNTMGSLFDSLHTLESVAVVSEAVKWLFEKAHQDALSAAQVSPEQYVAPITGGDDIRIFLGPSRVEPYVRTLSERIEKEARSFRDLGGALAPETADRLSKIGIGVGVVVAGDKMSASWMLQRAHDLERSAKKKCLNGSRSAVDFVWVSSGEAYIDGASSRREAGRDSRPLSLDGPWGDYVHKTRKLGDVPAKQRAMVAERRLMSKEEFDNLFRYQVARSLQWQSWYKAIGSDWTDREKVIADIPDAGMLDLLRILGAS